MGKSNIEVSGHIEVKCKEYKTVVHLDFSEGSMWNTTAKQVAGYL